jgi:hypothetical protein
MDVPSPQRPGPAMLWFWLRDMASGMAAPFASHFMCVFFLFSSLVFEAFLAVIKLGYDNPIDILLNYLFSELYLFC